MNELLRTPADMVLQPLRNMFRWVVMLVILIALDASAQVKRNTWSQTWSKEHTGQDLDRTTIALGWRPPVAGTYTTTDLASSITLTIDPIRSLLWRPADLTVSLRVTAQKNPDPDKYRKAADRDSIFEITLAIGHRWSRDTSTTLDPTLDRRSTDRFEFHGSHSFSVEVVSITVNTGDGQERLRGLPESVSLDLELSHSFRELFDAGTIPEFTSRNPLDCGGETHELQLSWLDIGGATEYQLEWTFVDDIAGPLPQAPLDPNELMVDLRRDATRVSIKAGQSLPTYRIPLIYDRGWLVYRVRALAHQGNGEIITGQWTNPSLTFPTSVVSFGADRFQTQAHQPLKNWQLSSVFAEEGKHKEVITYADGSLRSRQSVTRASSLDIPVVAETVYDVFGRPAAEVMPVPMIVDQGCEEVDGHRFAPIDFYPEFNVVDANGSLEAFNGTHLSAQEVGCGMAGPPLDPSSGASLYYSPEQYDLGTDRLIGDHPYIPQAFNYPYAQTEYTPDNTGRVKRKGGVGPVFQLGNGHETSITYGMADQLQLDRLFGVEAGFDSYYQRTVTVDANGQSSVTYTDRAGRTVATALVGTPPTTLEQLDTYTDQTPQSFTSVGFCPPLPSNTCESNTYDPALRQWTYAETFTVEAEAQFTFNHSITLPTITFSCPQDFCVACAYRLELILTDECGEVKNEYSGQVGHFDGNGEWLVYASPALVAGAPQPQPVIREVTLPPGSYTFTRKLTVHEEARATYAQAYQDAALTNCQYLDQEELEVAQLELAEPDGCVSCTSCMAQLAASGGLDGFLLTGGTVEEYELLEQQCEELCAEPSWCDVAYKSMLQDLSPGGQYAKYSRLNGVVEASDPTSIFRSAGDCILARRFVPSDGWYGAEYNQRPVWQHPRLYQADGSYLERYIDDNGHRLRIPVFQLEDGSFIPALVDDPELEVEGEQLFSFPEFLVDEALFMDSWQTGWARSLLYLHPEYPYYLDCRAYQDQQAGYGQTSDEFDAWFRGLEYGVPNDEDVINAIIADVTVLFQAPGSPQEHYHDPFFASTAGYDPQQGGPLDPVYGDQVRAFWDRFTNYAVVDGVTLNMLEVLLAAGRCGSAFITPPCYAPPYLSGNTDIDAALWQRFRATYLAEKYRYQKRRGDMRARGLDCNPGLGVSGLNFCIGQDADDFMDWQPRMMENDPSWLPPWAQWCQPCMHWSHAYYHGKVQRVQDPEQVPGAGEDPVQIAYQQYLVTGVCPATLAWQNFFNGTAIQDQLTITHSVQANPYFQAVELARQNMVLQQPLGEATWTPQLSPDQLHLDVTLDVDGVVCNIDLYVPVDAVDFDWAEIVRVPLLSPSSDGTFELTVEYMDDALPNETLQTTVLQGEMCSRYLLDPCNFPPVCEPNSLGTELGSLLGLLVHPDSGEDLVINQNSTTQLPVDVAENLGSELRMVIEAVTQTWFWGPTDLDATWLFDPVGPGFRLFCPDVQNGPYVQIDIESQAFPDFGSLEAALASASGISNFGPLPGDRFMCWFVNEDGEMLASIEGRAYLTDPEEEAQEVLSLGTCAPAPPLACAGSNEEVLNGLFAVVAERLLHSRDGNNMLPAGTGLDLFESPLMNGEIMTLLSDEYCNPQNPLNLYGPCRTTGLVSNNDDGTLTVTFLEDPCLRIEMPNVGFTDLIQPEPYGDADELGVYRAFSATMMKDDLVVGNMVVHHTCIDLSVCADCCDDALLQDLFKLVEDLALWSNHLNPAEMEMFSNPLMTPELLEILGPILDPEESGQCKMVGQFSSASGVSGSVLNYGKDGCFKIHTPKFVYGYAQDLVIGEWEAIEGVQEDGFIHAYRLPISYDTEHGSGEAHIVLDIPCVSLQSCNVPLAEPACAEPEDTRLLGQLARVIAERLYNNLQAAQPAPGDPPSVWLSPSIDLQSSPLLAQYPEIAAILDATWGTSTTSLFNSESGTLLVEGCLEIVPHVPIYTWTNLANLLDWSIVSIEPTVPLSNSITVHIGEDYGEYLGFDIRPLDVCLGLDVCGLWSPAFLAHLYPPPPQSVQVPQHAYISRAPEPEPCNPAVALPDCNGTPPPDCSEAYQQLAEVIDDYNDMHGGSYADLSLDAALCYFVNGYLCPCVEGYTALITSAMLDGVISAKEANNPQLTCIFNYCQLPDPCSPPPQIELPGLPNVPPPDSCDNTIAVIAQMNSVTLYEQQLVDISEDFHQTYDAGCQNVLETLSRTHTGRDEHHFTLYYYDQAGNLIRTVPPEGVEQAAFSSSNSAEALRIANDRASDTRTVFTTHRLASDYVFNSLEQPVRQKMPDQDAMALWESAIPIGIPSDVQVTSSHILPGGIGFLTANRVHSIPFLPNTLLRGMLFKTVDGGKSWSRSTNTVGSDLRSVAAVQGSPTALDLNTVFAIGKDGAVLRSLDAGTSWDLVTGTLGTHSQGFRDVVVYRQSSSVPLRGMAVGDNGALQRMTSGTVFNGNPAPQAIVTNNASHLTSVNVVPNMQRLYIGGRSSDGKNGVFFITGYDGSSFVDNSPHLTAEIAAALECGSMYSADGGYLAGLFGTLLHTSTGSSPTGGWTTVHTHTSAHFRDIYFLNALEGVAILVSATGEDPNGVLHATSDGGVTWSVFGDPADDWKDLNPYFGTTDQAKLIAVGEQGRLVRILMQAGASPTLHERPSVPGAPDLTASWALMEGNEPISLRCIVGDATGTLRMTEDLLQEDVIWSSVIDPDPGSTDPIHRLLGHWVGSNAFNVALVTRNTGTQSGKAIRGSRDWVTDQWVWSWTQETGTTYADMAPIPGPKARYYNTNADRLEDLDMSVAPMSAPVAVSNATATDVPTAIRILLATGASQQNTVLGGSSGVLFHGNAPSNNTWTSRSRSIKPLSPLHMVNDQPRAVGEKGTLFECIGTGPATYWKARPTAIASDLTGAAVYSGNTKLITVGAAGEVNLMDWTGTQPTATLSVGPVDLDDVVLKPSGGTWEATIAGDDGYLFHCGDVQAPSPVFTQMPFNGADLHGLTLLSNGEIVAVGDQASIHKASGTMRMAVNEVYLSGMNDVHFHDADHGYAVGDHMVVRYTNNGGQTWQPVPSNETVASTVTQRNLNAVYASSPTQGITVGQYGKRKTLNGTSMATLDQPVVSSGAALHWNDVTVSAAGAVLIVGELSGAGRHVTKLPSSSSYSALVSSTVPLKKIWHWQPFPINGTMQEEYLVGNLNGNLRLVKRQPTPSAPFDATQITGAQPASLLSGAITAMWFHDRSTGFAATTPGRFYRLNYAEPDHHNGTVVMTPSATDLGVAGSGIWPDDLDGQTVPNNIRINTIQFADRHLGFLGGAYTGTPVRYARTIRDEVGLYSQRFWYDKLGRLVLSQNTKQFNYSPKKRYSYSRYDKLGRVFESGEVEEGAFLFKDIFGSDVEGEFQNTAIEQENLESFLHAGHRFEVTRTHYDEPFYNPTSSDIDDQFLAGEQQNLRLRVASTTYEEQYDEDLLTNEVDGDPLTYEHATHYSYDIHGNVKELVQESEAMRQDAPGAGQAFKHIAYTYDLVSGNVHQVDYQDNKPDQFHHRYTYDADNRITKVETNRADKEDEASWREDGAYFYYPHGPLLRTELGENKVQGMDYAYTLQGWLKAINSNGLQQNQDMGHDSDPDLVDNPHAAVARDAFGLSLHYFDPGGGDADKDYYPISDAVWNNSNGQRFIAKGPISETGRDLYNGNISAMVRSLPPVDNWYAVSGTEGTPQILGWRFKYDQLNRLREANTRKGLNAANDWTDVGVVDALHKSQYTYDANGNILTAQRWDQNGDLFDDLAYRYSRSEPNGNPTGKLWRNRLYHLKDAGLDNLVTQADDGTEDLLFKDSEMADVVTDPWDENASGSDNHYRYDDLGNLIRDQREGLANIDWTATGKVRAVEQAALSGERYHLGFGYGVGNHRINKTVTNGLGIPGAELQLQHREHYVHDAQGNVMAIYRYTPAPDQNSPLRFEVTQRPIYGSSRLGLDDWDQEAHDPTYDENQATGAGKVRYELTDHLGNVCAVVTDEAEGYNTDADPEAEEWHAGLLSVQEYEPFGSLLPGRNFYAQTYRYGFNGKENDNEIQGTPSTAVDFGSRSYGSREGRWFTLDPLAPKYAGLSPYQFGANNPAFYIDPDGADIFGYLALLRTPGIYSTALRIANASPTFLKLLTKFQNISNGDVVDPRSNVRVGPLAAIPVTFATLPTVIMDGTRALRGATSISLPEVPTDGSQPAISQFMLNITLSTAIGNPAEASIVLGHEAVLHLSTLTALIERYQENLGNGSYPYSQLVADVQASEAHDHYSIKAWGGNETYRSYLAEAETYISDNIVGWRNGINSGLPTLTGNRFGTWLLSSPANLNAYGALHAQYQSIGISLFDDKIFEPWSHLPNNTPNAGQVIGIGRVSFINGWKYEKALHDRMYSNETPTIIQSLRKP
ncbi:MAG: hypothetical protein JNN32_09095 [Flavobacteriales bacterium]|nr:hypothetical protein [Flavobacteriales bacterium]